EVPPNLDPARRCARLRLDAVAVERDDVLAGARTRAGALARTLLCAGAGGGGGGCGGGAPGYAQTRQQIGRPSGGSHAIKRHHANMLVAAELATAATWDAAQAADGPAEPFELAAAVAATLALPAFSGDASLNVQVHGGIGFTWEHDAHLFQRRATTL